MEASLSGRAVGIAGTGGIRLCTQHISGHRIGWLRQKAQIAPATLKSEAELLGQRITRVARFAVWALVRLCCSPYEGFRRFTAFRHF